MNDARRRLGSLLRKARRSIDPPLTQGALAERLETTQPSVSDWESGKSVPPASVLHDLSRELGLDPAELLEAVAAAGAKAGAVA